MAADKVWPRNAPYIDKMDMPDANISHYAWERIYAILRLYPEGINMSDFNHILGRMWGKPFGGQDFLGKCRVRTAEQLLLRLPHVEVKRLKSGQIGFYLRPADVKKVRNYGSKKNFCDNIRKTAQQMCREEETETEDDENGTDVGTLVGQDYSHMSTGTDAVPKNPQTASAVRTRGIPKWLRERLEKLATKFKYGVDTVTFNERYQQKYHVPIKPREYGMDMPEIFVSMYDVLDVEYDDGGKMWIKAKSVEKEKAERRGAAQRLHSERTTTGYSSVSAPLNDLNWETESSSTLAEQNLNSAYASAHSASSSIINENDLIGPVYEKLLKCENVFVSLREIPYMFTDVRIVKNLEQIDLLAFFYKNNDLFEIFGGNKNDYFVKIRDHFEDTTELSAFFTGTTVTGMDAGTGNRESYAASVCSGSTSSRRTGFTKITAEDLQVLFRNLNLEKSGVDFESAEPCFEFYCQKPVRMKENRLLGEMCRNPQYFVMDFIKNRFRARQHKVVGKNESIAPSSGEQMQLKYLILEAGERFEVTVSQISSPVYFYVQFHALQRKFKKMSAKMRNVYETDRYNMEYTLKPGLVAGGYVCAAFVRNEWRRVEIQDVFQDLNCHIFCMDFGFAAVVKAHDLRRLTPEFTTLPVMAVRVHLKGIEPNNAEKEWDSVVYDYIQEYKEKPKIIVMYVENTPENEMTPDVSLCAKFDENAPLVDIAKDLVCKSYARYLAPEPNNEQNLLDSWLE